MNDRHTRNDGLNAAKAARRAARIYWGKEDKLAKNAAKAKELGLSYGTYMAYLETGYLDEYIERRKNAPNDENCNVIVSCIGGGRTKLTARD